MQFSFPGYAQAVSGGRVVGWEFVQLVGMKHQRIDGTAWLLLASEKSVRLWQRPSTFRFPIFPPKWEDYFDPRIS